MATTLNELKRLQREVETLKKRVARLERRGNGKKGVATHKPSAHKQSFVTIRQAAQRNGMTEEEAMALALDAQHAPR